MNGAWGAGLATFSDDRVLEVFYPAPALGAPAEGGEAGTRELAAGEAARHAVPAGGADDRRGVREAPILTVIADLAAPPADAADAYLRLHLLSHRLVRPRGLNLDGIFGVLPNVAWTSRGPVDPARLTEVRLRVPRARRARSRSTRVDKFPRMTDYVDPGRACAWPTPTACAWARTSPRAPRSCTRAS